MNSSTMQAHHAVIRRHSMNTKAAPLPPARRNSSITNAAPVQLQDRNRTRCTTPGKLQN